MSKRWSDLRYTETSVVLQLLQKFYFLIYKVYGMSIYQALWVWMDISLKTEGTVKLNILLEAFNERNFTLNGPVWCFYIYRVNTELLAFLNQVYNVSSELIYSSIGYYAMYEFLELYARIIYKHVCVVESFLLKYGWPYMNGIMTFVFHL